MSYSPQDLHKKILGRKGEKTVENYCKKQGYVILKRNYRTPFGEADLIAKDKDEIVFIEVKTRLSDAFGQGIDAITPNKKMRYYQIAKCYALELHEEPNARFDVAQVDEQGNIDYFKNAF